ncbi:NAD(P)H-dependent oxidoreductase [Aliifodinibius sp. S!AR15-10]|uniref:NADPH-dependent FMN reductase n=1 Tax=Aliifodinibius sp. S!AR15-10 TaxID=2950437 RepID=UPI002859A39D|nr:NAD(P)H-dependent oxidoreductase [Aliifodinibius sp. S!AR15-10]MDR8393761.1 NAD(P)H-dependent oxidoreductase [Aliifodinibius sp. S!AR15-10]
MKVAILLGSVRMGRQTHKAAYYLKNELINRNIETDLIDLAEDSLPILRERAGHHPDPPENALQIGERLDDADALLLVTPEYHGSISGVLKNAIDYYWSEFKKKPIGVVTASAGSFGGINASHHLQEIILSIGAYPMPMKLLVSGVGNAFDDSFEPQHDDIVKSTDKFLDEFLWFADAIHQKKINAYDEEAA